MFRKIGLFVIVWAILAFGTPVAGAGLITFGFEGTLDSNIVDPGGFFDSPPPSAPPFMFSGTYTFDPLAPDTDADPTMGNYDAATAFTFDLGVISFASQMLTTMSINVIDSTTDDYEVTLEATDPSGDTLMVDIRLSATPPVVFDSDAMPLIPPDLQLFGENKVDVSFGDGTTTSTGRGSLTSLIPEPASSTLLGVCVLGLIRSRRRRAGSRRRLHRR